MKRSLWCPVSSPSSHETPNKGVQSWGRLALAGSLATGLLACGAASDSETGSAMEGGARPRVNSPRCIRRGMPTSATTF